MNPFDLTGKTAFVSGATHGLGMAMAIGLAEAGAKLIISSTSPDKLKGAIYEYTKRDFNVTCYNYLPRVLRD